MSFLCWEYVSLRSARRNARVEPGFARDIGLTLSRAARDS